MQPNVEGGALYWQLSKKQPIRAWYPATAVTNADISNQSGGYASFDYLTSDGTYDFASSVSLTFNHQMAKVKCTLSIGEGITEENLSSATVKIYVSVSAMSSSAPPKVEVAFFLEFHATSILFPFIR